MSKTEDRLESGPPPPPGAAGNGQGQAGSAAPEGPELGLPFAAYVPMGAVSRYTAPKATVDPDRSKTWVKRAMPILMAHKVQFFSALIFSFLGLIIQVWLPKILQEAITNSLILHTHPLHGYIELIAVLALFTGVFGYIARSNLFKVAYSLEFDLRNILYEHFTRMSFPFYDRVQSGQLISRANSDIRSVQMYLTFAPSILVQCSIAIVAFGFMLSISVPLAFVAMAAMPFIYWTGIRMRHWLFPVSWLIQSRLAEVATVVDENVNGVRVVRGFAAEQQQLRQLGTAADRVQWAYIKDADLRSRFAPLIQNLSQVGLVFVLLVGGWMVIHENLPVASIVSFNLYLVMMQAPFMMLGMLIMMGQRASASAERIYEILDERPSIVDRPGAIDLMDSMGDVEFDNVSFSYAADSLLSKPAGAETGDETGDTRDEDGAGSSGAAATNGSAAAATDGGPASADGAGGRNVLHDLNLHLRPGETVALVGRTGSGKSTVARVLARFYDATSGTVRVDGHDVRDLTLTSLRGNIGVVLDEPFLFSVSIRDNIAYGRPDATIEEVKAAAESAGAAGFISRLSDGYDTVVGERGYTLSGGQRQRIAIARALLVNPPILILDDATSAIDVKVEHRIHSALRVLMQGRTTLIIAHRLSTISLADRVVLLDDGRIVADGTHAELLASTPLYAEVLAQAASEEEAAEETHDESLGLDDEINDGVLEPEGGAI
jgi:ATP-binding cassette, subfamily B, bacterial